MSRQELLLDICYDCHTDCDNCFENMNKILDEYDKQIRVDAIDELGKVLCDELDKGYIFINKHQILHFTEQLKEQMQKGAENETK